MLAFVKLRAAAGDLVTGVAVEKESRRIIHTRASQIDSGELAAETRRVRLALEKQRSRARVRQGDVDIKYGAGGMLDVYFAMRYLQLSRNVPDENDRSTKATLSKLKICKALTETHYTELLAGYEFLSSLDHYLRLTVGRKTRVPLGNVSALETIAERMGLSSAQELVETLTIRRLAVRAAFEDIVP
jgi:glutamine synthetase adenylyltransferase